MAVQEKGLVVVVVADALVVVPKVAVDVQPGPSTSSAA